MGLPCTRYAKQPRDRCSATNLGQHPDIPMRGCPVPTRLGAHLMGEPLNPTAAPKSCGPKNTPPEANSPYTPCWQRGGTPVLALGCGSPKSRSCHGGRGIASDGSGGPPRPTAGPQLCPWGGTGARWHWAAGRSWTAVSSRSPRQ